MIPVLAPTSAGFERWCAPLHGLLDAVWPAHPPVWFVSEKGTIPSCNTILVRTRNWVMRVYQGAMGIERLYPDVSHVLVMLEETFPLHAFECRKVERIAESACRHGLNCVSFVPGGEWREGKRVRHGGETMYETPSAHRYYSQNSTGIWKISHLKDVCRCALRKGLRSVWEFEGIKASGHYVSTFPWPNVAGGIFNREWINPRALDAIGLPCGAVLKQLLGREYLAQQFEDAFAHRRCRLEMKDLMAGLKPLCTAAGFRVFKVLESCVLSEAELAAVCGMPRARIKVLLEAFLEEHMVVKREYRGRAVYRVNSLPDGYYSYAGVVALARLLGNDTALVRADRERACRIIRSHEGRT
jgi:hypothetical protein